MKRIWLFLISASFFALNLSLSLAAVSVPDAAAEIDALIEANLNARGMKRNDAVGDEVFVRRIYLDLAGRIPTTAEASEFFASRDAEKRRALIRALLSRESYVSNFYNLWADVLRYKSFFNNTANVIPAAYGAYIKDSLRSNKPYDQFVREMLSAKGYAWDNGAIGYYQRDPEMPLDNMAITSRIFLGTRMECAQCHDHPFDKWKQTEFYHLAAYTHSNRSIHEAFEGPRIAMKTREERVMRQFHQEKSASTDGGKAAAERKDARIAALDNRGVVGIIKSCVGQLFSPIGLSRDAGKELKLPHDFKEPDGKPFDVMDPAPFMGGTAEVSPGQDPAEAFAQWVASPENPRFTKVIVNRLWRKMFGLPLTEFFDELKDDRKAMLPDVEAHLEKLMVALGYDMKAFLEIIANTRAYQSAVTLEEFLPGSDYPFQGPLLRRMTAEQIWDSIVTLASEDPDAQDVVKLAREKRRIQVSKLPMMPIRILMPTHCWTPPQRS